MKTFRHYLAAVAVAVGLMAPAAQADPIGPGCPSCFGGIYELVFQPISSTHYLIGLAMDLRNTTGLAPGTNVEAVAFKVANENYLVSSILLGTNAPGAWTAPVWGGLSNAGCDADPGAGFICTGGGAAPIGFIYGWVFDVVISDPTKWLDGLMEASIKVDFGPANGLLLSENITLQPGTPTPNPQCVPGPCVTAVPEPAPLALIAIGLMAAGIARRRKS